MDNNRYAAINSDKITRAYFDDLLIEMRHMDAVKPDMTFELYGHSFKTPIMMAALSHLKGKDGEDGMVQMAQGAQLVGAVNWCGMSTNEQYAAIAAVGVPTIRIIKPYADEEAVLSRIKQAEELGAIAIGMDLDHSFNHKGEYDDVLGHKMRPRTMKEIENYCKNTKLPFIIKGVLSVVDAKKCVEAGVSGIVVSHHHSIAPSVTPPLMVLPDIVKAIDGKMPIFVDCGIVNGIDAFKALALGANAVSVGRAVMPPIVKQGAEGAANTIKEITEELAGMMARTCSPKVTEIDSDVIWKR